MQTFARRMARFPRSMGLVAILSSLWAGTGWAVCGEGVVDAPSTVSCYGDLDDSRTVTVDELVALVQFALIGGAPGGLLDRGTIGEPVSVELILRAINHALVGCPIGTVNSQEDCDDGGICIGDATAGTACTADADCGEGANGVCAAGSKFLHGCATDDECPGSVCIRCKSFGGDGCSANCTIESILDFQLKPGRTVGPRTDGVCLGGDARGRRCQVDTECSGGGQWLLRGRKRQRFPRFDFRLCCRVGGIGKADSGRSRNGWGHPSGDTRYGCGPAACIKRTLLLHLSEGPRGRNLRWCCVLS